MIFNANYENVLKGRIAEAIIEAIFNGSGVEIWRTGFEWIRPLFPHESHDTAIAINKKLGGMPDFYLLRAVESVVEREYIEVKFRSDGRLSQEDTDALQSNPWRPTVILIQQVSNPESKIRVIRPPYKARGGGYQFSKPIKDESGWGIKPEIAERCENFLMMFYYWDDMTQSS